MQCRNACTCTGNNATQDLFGIGCDNVILKMYFPKVTGGSANMEPFAAKSILTSLVTDYSLDIATFTTDRSSSMRTLMREPGLCHIGHEFDPWHWISMHSFFFYITNIQRQIFGPNNYK